MTVREMVHEAQVTLRGELTPTDARALLVRLSSLLGNCNDECREADLAYAHVLLAAYGTEETANRATIRAQCSPEYARLRVAKDTRALVLEMSRSLKAYLRSLDEEMRLAK
mgnify:CR=1 FL=1